MPPKGFKAVNLRDWIYKNARFTYEELKDKMKEERILSFSQFINEAVRMYCEIWSEAWARGYLDEYDGFTISIRPKSKSKRKA
jgi:hypothetical protein